MKLFPQSTPPKEKTRPDRGKIRQDGEKIRHDSGKIFPSRPIGEDYNSWWSLGRGGRSQGGEGEKKGGREEKGGKRGGKGRLRVGWMLDPTRVGAAMSLTGLRNSVFYLMCCYAISEFSQFQFSFLVSKLNF